MAIKLKSLERLGNTLDNRERYLYKDLALDITENEFLAPGFKIPVPGTDIKASFDLAAIKNSLQNLFNTKPGERFLYPEYGLDLQVYLFLPITELNANIIGSKIFNTINSWEPRVNVKNVTVIIDPDNNQYLINIIVDVPTLNINTTIETVLDIKKQTFTVLPTSQIR
jgi:phage baseplate assembly protein W